MNNKHIKTKPIITEQYLRDVLAWHTDDLVDRILKHYETLSTDKVQSNTSNKRRKETYKSNTVTSKLVIHKDIP